MVTAGGGCGGCVNRMSNNDGIRAGRGSGVRGGGGDVGSTRGGGFTVEVDGMVLKVSDVKIPCKILEAAHT